MNAPEQNAERKASVESDALGLDRGGVGTTKEAKDAKEFKRRFRQVRKELGEDAERVPFGILMIILGAIATALAIASAFWEHATP